ncbi:type VI secretion system tube protein Hcp, partial [Enterobacter sp. SECR19-1250]|uniref:type VI secretion system tube protein Hcp n=1 Tax=Enterobacter sp. SECR19-1250 TaxID=2749084 RepID=UPI0015B6AB62
YLLSGDTATVRCFRGLHQEVEYFNMYLEGVKVVSVCPVMHDVKDPTTEKHNHLESISLRYERITWKHCDGNIIFTDSWADR